MVLGRRETKGSYSGSCSGTTATSSSMAEGGLNRWVTVLVTIAPSPSSSSASSCSEAVRLDPSMSGFLSTMLQDDAFAQEHVNTDAVIADLSEDAMDPEFAADIATTLQVAHGRVQVTDVATASQTLRGADYLQLREELYLEAAAQILFQALQAPPPPSPLGEQAQAVVVPCVHTGQRMWDRLGAYNTLQLEKRGLISLGHKGHIDAADERIDDELLPLAATLNDVTSLDLTGNSNVTTCEPFGSTLQELVIDSRPHFYAESRMGDEGLKHCRKLRKLQCTGKVTTCEPFADTLEEFIQTTFDEEGEHGIDDEGLKHCTKLKRLIIPRNKKVTTCSPFAGALEELDISCCTKITDAGLKDVKHLKRLKANGNEGITTCEPFADTLEELEAQYGRICDEGLKHCTKLKVLDASDSPLDVLGNPLVTTCDPFAATLEKVTCNIPGLTDEGLKRCTKVKEAAIYGKVTPAPFAETLESIMCDVSHIEHLQRCTQLKVIRLFSDGTQPLPVPLSSLASFSDTLEELSLSFVSLSGELNVFKRLRVLQLHETPGSIGTLPSTLEKLWLTFHANAPVNDETLKACTKLRELSLEGCRSITTCDPFASTLEDLTVLEGCAINDEGLKHCTNLKKLELSSCPHITHCDPFATTLEKLTVNNHCGLTNESVRRCVRLTALITHRKRGVLTVRLKDLTYS